MNNFSIFSAAAATGQAVTMSSREIADLTLTLVARYDDMIPLHDNQSNIKE